MVMELTFSMAAIVFIGVFFASFIDSIAGGGGIISVPCYLLAGLPAHYALGTNKLSAGLGTIVSAVRYIKNGYVNFKLGIPCVILAISGASLGTRLQLMVPDSYLQYFLLLILPVIAFIVLRQRQLPETAGEIRFRKQLLIVCAASFLIGTYDGFYGPGTGTFLLLVYCTLAKMDIRTAGGNTKLVNLSSNMGALVTSILNGKVFFALGLIGTAASFAGHFLGSGLAIKNGSRIVKPAILVVLLLLAAKVIQGLLAG